MALTIGAVLLAAFLVPPQRSGYLDVAGYRALRAASWTAAGWAAAAVLLVPLNVADALGRPVGDVLDPGLLLDLVPRLCGGHRMDAHRAGRAARARRLPDRADLGLDRRAVRAGPARPAAGDADRALRRRGRARRRDRQPGRCTCWPRRCGSAGWWRCWPPRPPRARPGGGAGHRRAAVLPAGAGLLAGAGRHRRGERAGADPAGGPVRLGLRRARAGEGGGAGGARRDRGACTGAPRCAGRARRAAGAAAAGRHRGPADAGHDRARRRAGPQRPTGHRRPCPSRTEASSATTWPGRPTLARLLFDWRFNLLFGTAALVLAAAYLLGVRRLRRRGDAWPVGRTVAWLAGCAGLLVATSSGLGPVRAGHVQRAHGPAHDPRRCWCRSCWCSAPR